MSTNQFVKAGLFAVLLLAVFLSAWELYCRSEGFTAHYDDNEPLWADKREMIYKPADKATVFIGSSRIKFALDVPTWESLTGEKAVQLAIVGSSPTPALYDLANDGSFKGKLVIDVTEPLFFSGAPPYLKTPNDNISYYKKRTPAQRFSFEVSHRLESDFAFLNKEYLSINALLDRVPLEKRKGIFHFPYFPHEFDRISFDRQNIMLDAFVKDTNLQNQMKANWTFLTESAKAFPPATEKDIDAVMAAVKTAVDKITARGGQVLFIRTPSSGPMWMGEQLGFPKNKFWDRLLMTTKAEGIHFSDYKETSDFICPEWSHLSPQDAIVYTQHLLRQIEQKGWKFPYKPSSQKPLLTSKL